MDQGWKRLSLLVISLLFWKNTDGFKGGAYSNAHDQWGQPSDSFSPGVVQSSMSEACITGNLPVEEVGSSLFSNKPLKSRSKLNLLQFVKGGASGSQSTSHAQTAPGSSVSASWPLDERPLSSLTSAGLTISGAASGLSLQSQYAASGSGPLVSTQGGSRSYPAELGVSGQSTSDGLHLSTSQGTSGYQSAETSLPVFSQESISYKRAYAPAATSTSQSYPMLLSESSGQRVSSQGEGSYSGLSQGASSPYTPGSLMSNKLDALPLGVSSQSTSAQSSSSGSPSTQSRFGTQLATSSRYNSIQGGSSSSFSHKPQSTLGQYAPLSPTKYASGPMSSPEAVHSQAISSGTSYRAVSQVGSPSQVGASGPFASRRGNYYSGLLPQSQATFRQYALGYSKPISSPQSTSSQSAGVLIPRKQYASASQSRSGALFGSSTGFASQGMSSSYSGSVQSQGTTSQFAPGSQSPYDGLYCKCALSPQGIDSEPTTVQSSRNPFTSSYGTQSGSFTPFTLQGSIIYDPQPQGTASQLGPVSHTYPSASSQSQGVVSQSTTVQGSRKRFTSTFTGDSGTQAGSSTPFTQQGSTTYGGSPQDAASQLVRGWSLPHASLSLSSPQAGQYTTLQGSRKQFTSTFTGGSGTQAGSSTPFTLQGSTAYGGSSQPQDAASPLVPGSSPYASVSLSSTQGAASQSSKLYKGYSVSQSRDSLKGQPSATRLTPVIRTSDATVSQRSSPMPLSSLSSAGGSSRVSGQFVSAHGGSTSYSGSFQSPSLSTKYTPGSQHLPFDTSVAGQGTSSASASEVLSSYSSMNNQNAPAQPSRRSSSSHFYSVKG